MMDRVMMPRDSDKYDYTFKESFLPKTFFQGKYAELSGWVKEAMMGMNVLFIPTAYMWTLLAVLLNSLYYYALPFFCTTNKYELIGSDVIDQFVAEHEAHTGKPGSRPPDGGLPDCGSGRYIMAAGYKSWMELMKG